MLNDLTWQRSDLLDPAEWKTTTRIPSDFKKIPREQNWEYVLTAMPAKKPKKEPAEIIVSFEPAELILLDGSLKTAGIGDTGIESVSNTESDLFVYDGAFYLLISGRWFSTSELYSDFSAVDTLPEAFKSIPPDHDKGHVLVSIPGTNEARVALIEAHIPRIAEIDPAAAENLDVYYAGEPEFVPVSGTSVERAANTTFQVLSFEGWYYLCYNAVWFNSTTPEGPWKLAARVPDEIYKIPPSDPAHNVTYVYVVEQEETPQTTSSTSSSNVNVYFGYTSGYYGMYPYHSVVYGTGYYYNPWYYYPPYGYPWYGGYPRSYGYGAWYNPANGRYGQRAVGYGPYGGAASTAVYNPRTGGYARGWSAWDNDELARSGYGYNPRNDTFAAGNMYYDFDDNSGWRESYVERGDNWIYADTDIDGNTRRTEFETGGGFSGTSERTRTEDGMTGSGTIEGNGRSATTQSRIDSEGAELNLDGSQGGNLDITQDRGSTDRELSGNTSSGESFTGSSERTDQGGRHTELSGESGGELHVGRNDGNRTAIGQTEGGDIYASRNGEVYKKGDDGWSQYGSGGWQDSNRNTSQSRDNLGSRSGSSSDMFSNYQRDYNNLDRQYDARQRGYSNHSQYRSQATSRSQSMNRGRARGGRRR